MDIKKLHDTVQAQIKDKQFQLSKITTGEGGFASLCAVFESDIIRFDNFSCDLNDTMLTLAGSFKIAGSDSTLMMTITAAEDGLINAAFAVPRLPLDSAGAFYAEDCRVDISINGEKNTFDEKINGTLLFGKITFQITSRRSALSSRRQFTVNYRETLEPLAFLTPVLALFGMDIAVFRIGTAKSFVLNSFAFTYAAPSGWLAAEIHTKSAQNKDADDYFKLDMKTSIAFNFYNKFDLRDVGFAVEKYGDEYDFSLYGMLGIFGADIPFLIWYGGDSFTLSASQCDNVTLTSINDMGALVGESDLLHSLPNGFKPSGKIKLNNLNLAVSSDFRSIQHFNTGVLLDYHWQLCESPAIAVSRILVSFGYTPSMKQLAITGTVTFCGVDTQLAAAVAMGAGGTKWSFMWRMYDEETVQLTDFIRRLAQEIGVKPTSIHLPDIEIGHVAVSYTAGRFAVQGSILVTNSKLFSSMMEISIVSDVKDGKRDFSAKFSWKSLDNALTVASVLSECGIKQGIESIPEFIRSIGVNSVVLEYYFRENKIIAGIDIAQIGKINIEIVFAGDKSYSVLFNPAISSLSLCDIPVAGGLVEKYLPALNDFSVSDINVIVLSKPDTEKNIPAGVRLTFKIMGEESACQLIERKPQELLGEEKPAPKTVWLNLEKTLAVFTLHRLGIGLDGSHLMLVLDASLNVAPLTFSLYGAGIGLNLSKLSDVKFYISGFGVAFKNDVLSISGEFRKEGKDYSGVLQIQSKQISVSALAEYSEGGYLMAYAVLSMNIGGPPALFITGLALGFGYNKKLILPGIEDVAKYPLITAAKNGISRESLISGLKKYIVSERGQKFLAAGIKFKSFEIIDSIAILTVRFGNTFEIGILGLSDATMPPHCDKNPIAHAQLALKVSIQPKLGFLGAEARLTSESYILSKACKLAGGFAFYLWYSGDKQGDMVLTLGGYKAGYPKPAHYPDVPRLGFNWKIGSNIKISGEMYFALTPREVMAGGRLSAVYSLGNLKAYFIAAADFYLGWKPFHYDASIHVTFGVSLRVDFLFVHHTFTIELGAGLHIWGPDFTGKAHISWFILSFDIYFGAGASQKVKPLDWDQFSKSFLPKNTKQNSNDIAPLTVSYTDGVVSSEDMIICRADDLKIMIESAVPPTAISVNQSNINDDAPLQHISIRPMGGAALSATLTVTIENEQSAKISTEVSFVKRNLPSAMWGSAGHTEPLVKDVICGVSVMPTASTYVLFPVKNIISLEQLYLDGTIVVKNAFAYQHVAKYPSYSSEKSVKIFAETVNAANVRRKRTEFLRTMGINTTEIALEKYASNAENLLSENILIKG